MAYYKNNNYRKKGGYKKNSNYKYYENKNYVDNRPQERPAREFDATRYKKDDITIRDLNGKVYTINGNFSTAFTEELVKAQLQIERIEQSEDMAERYSELLKMLKSFCLVLINQNVDGEKYTLDDVEHGFNDIGVLKALLIYIGQLIFDGRVVLSENKR